MGNPLQFLLVDPGIMETDIKVCEVVTPCGLKTLARGVLDGCPIAEVITAIDQMKRRFPEAQVLIDTRGCGAAVLAAWLARSAAA